MSILTVNSGSSSLKLGFYTEDGNSPLLSASIDGIGPEGAADLKLTEPDGNVALQQSVPVSDVHDAFTTAVQAMRQRVPEAVSAIGHRIVHGGPHLTTHQRLTKRVVQVMRDSVHFAPLHIPPALDLVRHVEGAFPGVPQFACFDTVFHQTMPPEAFTYAIPKPYRDAGVRRYGFHGLSYESVVRALGDTLPERTVVAHLGSGSSACALLHGKSIDTSMGVSPTGGFVMSTRTGDLDPGVALLLERQLADGVPVLTPDELERTANHDSGLKALAGTGDMRKLLERAEKSDTDAGLAVTVFCREVAKTLIGYATVLGGVDLIAFTGGIGEHSAPIRENICARLAFLGIALKPDATAPGLLSAKNSTVRLQVVPADENAMIARHVAALAR